VGIGVKAGGLQQFGTSGVGMDLHSAGEDDAQLANVWREGRGRSAQSVLPLWAPGGKSQSRGHDATERPPTAVQQCSVCSATANAGLKDVRRLMCGKLKIEA
jgi:hypothetical protein